MNSLKNIWSQFKKFIRFDQSTFIEISNDRYESGNALIVVLLSLLSIYIPLVINASVVNIADIIFYGVVDGIFAWLFANLAIWFLLSRAFNQQIEISSLLVFTGYTHGLVGFIGCSCFNKFFDHYSSHFFCKLQLYQYLLGCILYYQNLYVQLFYLRIGWQV